MQHPLFFEIRKFEDWAYAQLADPARISAEWELGYPRWADLIRHFGTFIGAVPAAEWSPEELEKLTYIIARDNECGRLIKRCSDEALLRLSEHALGQGEELAKWQLADELPRIANKQRAIELIERFVNDREEYVNRRALMALALLDADRTEFYCKKHWDRTIYGDMDEYQRMAILHSLKQISSPQLKHYLDLARVDGREFLLENAVRIEREVFGNDRVGY